MQIPKYVDTRVFIAFGIFAIGVNIIDKKKDEKSSIEQWRYVANLLDRNYIELDEFDLMVLPNLRKSKIRLK
jgi:hypothetical protein